VSILKALPEAKLYGVDRDESALSLATKRMVDAGIGEDRFVTIKGNYQDMSTLVPTDRVDGILLDIGVSSMQLDNPERGFSFRHDGPLDMRMDQSATLTAKKIVNEYPEHVLGEILKEYGEVRQWRKVAAIICRERAVQEIETTLDLVNVIGPMLNWKKADSHPATKTFQAIRIAVNSELRALDVFLSKVGDLLTPGGIVAILSFHPLEDRLVKKAFSDQRIWKTLSKKPLKPSTEEVAKNPRSRTAKLRVAIRQ